MDSYLHLKPKAVQPYQTLIRAVRGATLPVPCQSDPDKWTSWDRDGEKIPTDDEAMRMCLGCPVLNLCRDFAEKENPAIGVHGGKVYGAELVRQERSGLS